MHDLKNSKFKIDFQRFKFIKFITHFELLSKLSWMIIIAFLFSFSVRLYWVVWANDYPELFWNDDIMINTNDGYAFAEGARDRLAGFHQPNDLSYINFPLSIITAWLVKILPFSFERIILYMSAFFSSLIVIPILLISSEFRCIRAGFIGSLIACVANSYYNRTMVGYYDTDMLNIVLAMFILWVLIRSTIKNDKFCFIYIGFFVTFYNWWYPSSFSLNSAMLGAFLIYTIVFQRKRVFNFQVMILMLAALISIPLYLKILLLIAITFAFWKKSDFFADTKHLTITGGAVLLLFVLNGGLSPILFQLKFYIFRGFADHADILSNADKIVYKFYNVNQTIQESGFVSPEIFMQRISSNVIVFMLSLAGFVLLCFKHKEFLLSLPVLLLGFMAIKAGLRFTIYSVGVMGLGFGYLAYYLIKILQLPKYMQRILLLIITILALYPSIIHIKMYLSASVFYRSEVEILDKYKNIADREDYTLSWWDYGYPIRYYSDTKTLIDGGKHLGNDNFPVSFALFKDQTSAANMARIDVEFTERNFYEKFDDKYKQILLEYNYKPEQMNEFLLSLRSKNLPLPRKTRDVYFYLPDRMLNIFSTVTKFSNLDIMDGKEFPDRTYIVSDNYKVSNSGVEIGNGIRINPDFMSLNFEGQKLPINTLYVTNYDEKGKLKVATNTIDSSSPLFIIVMKDYGRILILDETMLKSTYIQLYVLENYDRDLYEPVILSPVAKIYRLKK